MRIINSCLIISCLIAGLANAQNRDISYMSSGGKLNPLQAIMDIRHYTLVLDIDIENKKIEGSNTIELVLSKNTDTLLFNLVHLLEVKKIKVNDKQVSFTHANDKIYIIGSSPFVGLLTGLVGAGGGFLIIPALVILSKLPIKEAVGTSLVIIAAKSLLGFLGESSETSNEKLFVYF